MMKKSLIIGAAAAVLLCSCGPTKKTNTLPNEVVMTKAELLDKIKGGWAGQTIGVTFGSYTEFRYNGTFIQDYQPILWHDGYVKYRMDTWPDLFDDIYMDLTFVDVLEREGLDAPVEAFANAFAYAGYNLWHANQAARYNLLNGIPAPESGHWKNNPHCDDLDYQIEADYAGLMNPGMVNNASEISDKVGHIMCYGDGWYGGVFVGAMYSLAFVSDDVEFVVSEALKTIPKESKFYQCIADVIKWHKQYPNDWKQTWFELQKKHSEDIGCPDGVFAAFNIDARINSAYIALGLLYGQGDLERTMEISTRAGQDSDCNPSSAAGILGTMMGYSNIPEKWMNGLKGSEDIDFKYTTMSLNKVYEIGYKHALEMIERSNGTVDGDKVIIKVQKPETVRFEESFPGMYPKQKYDFHNYDFREINFEFEGTGFAVRGDAFRRDNNTPEGVISATLYIDGEAVETAAFPTAFKTRRHDLFWKYQLPNGKHKVTIKVNDYNPAYILRSWEYLVYSDQPVKAFN